MFYIKQQSDQKTKLKSIWAQRMAHSKKRWYNHISNFKNYKENGTEISKYNWKLKNNNIDYKIVWEVIHHIGKARNPQSICSTCILEKIAIANADRRDSLNKRYELFYSCLHFKKLHFKT